MNSSKERKQNEVLFAPTSILSYTFLPDFLFNASLADTMAQVINNASILVICANLIKPVQYKELALKQKGSHSCVLFPCYQCDSCDNQWAECPFRVSVFFTTRPASVCMKVSMIMILPLELSTKTALSLW